MVDPIPSPSISPEEAAEQMWAEAARAAPTPSPAPGGLWELPDQRGLISPGLYVAAALFLSLPGSASPRSRWAGAI